MQKNSNTDHYENEKDNYNIILHDALVRLYWKSDISHVIIPQQNANYG